MKRGYLIAILALAATGVAQAQTLRDTLSTSEAREMRQEGDRVSADRVEFTALGEPRAVTFKATVGVAYTKSENDTKTWTTPIQFDVRMNGGDTVFKILSDGYQRSELKGETASGITDVTLRLSQTCYPFGKKNGSLITSGGVRIPVAGDVGGKSAKQDLQMTYALPVGDPEGEHWTFKGTGRARHFNDSAPPGVSQFSGRGLVASAYSWKKNTDVFVQLIRDQRRGAGSASSLTAGHNFVLPGANAALTLVRGLTKGSRDNTIEFDIAVSF